MIKEFVHLAKRILGMDRAGRGVAVFPDDTFIVSFPRSGNTWTRFLIANLLHPDQSITFANIEELIPDIHAQPKMRLNRVARPRVLKSHEYFDPRYKRVIYIVRDPRDVAVSSYYFHKKQRQIEESCLIDQYVTRFIAGTVWQTYASWGENVASWLATKQNGADKAALGEGGPGLFGSWAENVTSWLSTRQNAAGFLLLRYEDMLRDPIFELSKVAALLGIKATPGDLSRAVERASKEEMRRLEDEGAKRWVLTKNTRSDIRFVRAAESGGWKTALSPESARAIESAWGPLIVHLGYELSTPNIMTIDSQSRGLTDTESNA